MKHMEVSETDFSLIWF